MSDAALLAPHRTGRAGHAGPAVPHRDSRRPAGQRLDLRHVDNWSTALDLSILFRIWRAVVKGAGAY